MGINREYHRWHSPALGRDMQLLVFGHGGARVLVFPTSMGRFFEWEDRRMVAALGEMVERGWIQLFCVDSVDAESWYARQRHPAERVWRHAQYERYLLEEVLPFSAHRNPDPFLIVTGASFGAYHAMNLALRHPWRVGRVVALSGLYDVRGFAAGYDGQDLYFHNPSEYLVSEHDPARLDALRRLEIVVALGHDDPNRANNDHVSGLLWDKGIWHAYRLWDGWAHDWPWWREMIRRYIGGAD